MQRQPSAHHRPLPLLLPLLFPLPLRPNAFLIAVVWGSGFRIGVWGLGFRIWRAGWEFGLWVLSLTDLVARFSISAAVELAEYYQVDMLGVWYNSGVVPHTKLRLIDHCSTHV